MTTLVRRTDPMGLARGANSTGTGNAAFTAAVNSTAGTGSSAANASGFGAVNGYIAGLDDTVSSLTHLGARDMDPVLGVFTAPDPILKTEDQRGFTPYTYAFGNVINASDPTGLYRQPMCDCDYSGPVSAPKPGPSTPAPAASPVTQPTITGAPGRAISRWISKGIQAGALGAVKHGIHVRRQKSNDRIFMPSS